MNKDELDSIVAHYIPIKSDRESVLSAIKDHIEYLSSTTPSPVQGVEEAAKEYAEGMMGIGEYSDKWHYNDKVMYNNLYRAVLHGGKYQRPAPSVEEAGVKSTDKEFWKSYLQKEYPALIINWDKLTDKYGAIGEIIYECIKYASQYQASRSKGMKDEEIELAKKVLNAVEEIGLAVNDVTPDLYAEYIKDIIERNKITSIEGLNSYFEAKHKLITDTFKQMEELKKSVHKSAPLSDNSQEEGREAIELLRSYKKLMRQAEDSNHFDHLLQEHGFDEKMNKILSLSPSPGSEGKETLSAKISHTEKWIPTEQDEIEMCAENYAGIFYDMHGEPDKWTEKHDEYIRVVSYQQRKAML